MGLDSVELLMMVEDYFGIRISNTEAEKIYTVQDMTDVVAKYKNINSNNMMLRTTLLTQLSNCTNKALELDDLIAKYLPNDASKWQALEQQMDLNIPKPYMPKQYNNKLSYKLMQILYKITKPNYEWQAITVEQFITAIGACNYQTLVQPENLKDKYEIYIAVVGITVDKVGVDYYEISPEKSFTSDLGVD